MIDAQDTAVAGTSGFLKSALSPEGRHSETEVLAWLQSQQTRQKLKVCPIPFAELDQWSFIKHPLHLAHRSGKFFTIEGRRVTTDFGPVLRWDQPIICQPEIGILGIITCTFNGVRHFLMQAKIEPGNINGVQISPTVQATRSNYTRVHRGARTPFLEFFVEPGRARLLVDQLQGEQGSRFYRKRNRNMIVQIPEEVGADLSPDERFCWLTLGQLKQLLREDNLVNMDARSVLACVPFSVPDVPLLDKRPEPNGQGSLHIAPDLLASLRHNDQAHCSTDELIHWLTDLRARYTLQLQPRPLDQLDCWQMNANEIRHESGHYFSVIAVQVEAGSREVRRWTQPLLKHPGYGLNGFLMQRIHGIAHLLVRACMYPGNHELFELGSTVSRSNADIHFGRPDAPRFLDYFYNPPLDQVRYAAVQSEEGGRFYHYQNRYIIRELPSDITVEPSPAHRWMTLGQIQNFVRHGYFNIEGRNLLACLEW
ncbi:MAG: NDP-hexose 2,3-dehydratase family protein [Candidatus Promineifilaceae bacterium]|nr:NDP-hexose 2,3-dehydratase family protein [Candidatus Promineifilaceae bacterium]